MAVGVGTRELPSTGAAAGSRFCLMWEAEDLPALVAAALDGDSQAWNRLVEVLSATAWGTISAYGMGAHEREDIYQRVFLKLTAALPNIREPQALPKWIMRVAEHECYGEMRRKKRTTSLEGAETMPDPAIGPEESALALDESTLLGAALRRLDEQCRHLLLLRANRVSMRQTAVQMGMAMGSIGPTYGRCKDKLARTPEMVSLRSSGRLSDCD